MTVLLINVVKFYYNRKGLVLNALKCNLLINFEFDKSIFFRTVYAWVVDQWLSPIWWDYWRMSRNHYFAGILHSIYNLLTAHIPLMLVTAIIIVYSSVNNTATPEKHPQLPATHVSDTRQHNVDNSPHHRLQPAEKSVCIDVRPRVKFLCNISSLDLFV